mmetsp:Transcript_9234/g.9341  ORF Transcript_9234/g.9341 Transcript_9234/m.9341 type:complete len:156 (-) Transcript_9234:204-671(-)
MPVKTRSSIPPLPDSPVLKRKMVRTITNPYYRNIEIATFDGLNLFHKAVEGLDKKFDAITGYAKKIKRNCERESKKFNWGAQVTSISNGTMKFDLFTQHAKIIFSNLRNNAKPIWEIDLNGFIVEEISTNKLAQEMVHHLPVGPQFFKFRRRIPS